MPKFSQKLQHAWSVFSGRTNDVHSPHTGVSSGTRQDRPRVSYSNERSIIGSIYNRLSVDAASVVIRHVRLDEDGEYQEDITSGIDDCFNVSANLDQAGRHFRQDIYLTMCEMGDLAMVPIETTIDPDTTGGYDIRNIRVGLIKGWLPGHVHCDVYNEETGAREPLTLDKKFAAVVENPFYNVMNEPNSTLQRLIRKLNLLDVVDEASSSSKLDIIIQLPYTVRSDQQRDKADQRLQEIEFQLKNSAHGIAYADATEKITQLNRPAENTLLPQIEFLTKMLYDQLGITPEIMNGTADEGTMLNYMNRTIEPMVAAVVESAKRTFLTKTARSQRQSFEYFLNLTKFMPLGDLAEVADILSRNEIVAPNEIRTRWLHMKPSKDPNANKLMNSNMPQPDDSGAAADAAVNSALDEVEGTVNEVFSSLGVNPDEAQGG